jgi:tetratricopeptide (TPR) repeat protein
MQKARLLIGKGELKNAAKLLNKLPALTDGAILKEIPEEFLSPRRKLERLYFLFETMPRLEFFRKARKIRKSLEKNGYLFSSIFAGFLEIYALQWMREPEKQLEILNLISKRMGKIRDTSLRFLLYFHYAMAYSDLLLMEKAMEYVKKCRRLISSLPYPFYWESFGDLATFVSKFKDSIFCYQKIIEKMEIDETTRQRLFIKLAAVCGITGEYQQCGKFLRQVQTQKIEEAYLNLIIISQANIYFAEGNLDEASHLYQESLDKARGANLRNLLYGSILGLAQTAQALNKRKEAYALLKKYLPLMKKYRMKNEMLNLRFLLNQTIIPQNLQNFSIYHLRFLLHKATKTLRSKDYYTAFNFAKENGLLGVFHRYIVFFPEIILHLLEKGKPTKLPSAILKFPVFNQLTPVYHLKILGNLLIYKNQKFLRARLTPREGAFLINFALRAGEPERFIILKELFQNFWPGNENPKDNLLHLLARIKKKLMLPGHLLVVSSGYGESELHNKGVYFTTDYQEFEQTLARAKALQRAGEWEFAKKEYLQAFKLFRGEPFKKNFDDWSVNMRFRILSELETEAINFAKACLEHNNKRVAKKTLEKVLKIIPDSEEVHKTIANL